MPAGTFHGVLGVPIEGVEVVGVGRVLQLQPGAALVFSQLHDTILADEEGAECREEGSLGGFPLQSLAALRFLVPGALRSIPVKSGVGGQVVNLDRHM